MIITESDIKKLVSEVIKYYLNEDVFVNNTRGNKAMLTYQPHQKYNKGNLSSADMLKTDKMEQQNADTYEVTLKGGLKCFNITSINGTEVMHYFKRKFSKNEKTMIKLKNGERKELTMLDREYQDFMNTFIKKVEFVINYNINKFKQNNPDIDFQTVSIYPVPSSSNFNEKMAQELLKHTLCGMNTQVINSHLLQKDMSNLERDEKFIEKNKDFYNSPYFIAPNPNNNSVNQELNLSIAQNKRREEIRPLMKEMNILSDKMIGILYRFNFKQSISERITKNLVNLYKRYYDLFVQCGKIEITNTTDSYNKPIHYTDPNTNETKRLNKPIIKPKKSSKTPSNIQNTDTIWQIVSPYLSKEYKRIPINQWEFINFQIKNYGDSVRMGMKNLYQPNTDDMKMVQEELDKIKGTIFIIFDDNVSGGATLSDVCYQCSQLGIENVIPITFGKMALKTTINMVPLNTTDYNYN